MSRSDVARTAMLLSCPVLAVADSPSLASPESCQWPWPSSRDGGEGGVTT
jgi:hypothetical protein